MLGAIEKFIFEHWYFKMYAVSVESNFFPCKYTLLYGIAVKERILNYFKIDFGVKFFCHVDKPASSESLLKAFPSRGLIYGRPKVLFKMCKA